jgi:phage host-nuclease inhibitor protein Gam
MAKTTRVKKELLPTHITATECEEHLAEWQKADAEMQKTLADMDLQITKIREKYQAKIEGLTAIKSEKMELVQRYAELNRETLFSKKKSIQMLHSIIGFRTSTPGLKTQKGFTWAGILELLRAHAPEFIRTKEEPNKDGLLAIRNEDGSEALFKKCGIIVEQTESFFLEPYKEGGQDEK